MTIPRPASPSLWRSVLTGVLLGSAAALLTTVAVLAASLLIGAPLMLILSAGFDSPGMLVASMALLALLLAIGAALVWLVRRYLLSGRLALAPRPLHRLAAVAGAIAALTLALLFSPAVVRETALQLATGHATADRSALPASEDERRHIKDTVRPAALAGDPVAQVELALALLRGAQGESRDAVAANEWIKRAAALPQGHEARLLLAVDSRSESLQPGARLLTEDDTAVRVNALRQLKTTLPNDWLPALLGTIGEAQRKHYGSHPNDQAMRDAMFDAGSAGSRAFAVLAAQHDEDVAVSHDRQGQLEQSDAAWQRALAGYARAGALFEVARLRDEALPDRLRALPLVAEALVPMPAPNAQVADRLWRFAWLLGADPVHERASPGQRDLATMLALLAMERGPNAPEFAGVNPAQRWSVDPWALGRWLKVLRLARGDCAAAAELSDATSQRRRRASVNSDSPPASSLDLAWTVAWAEAGENCARTDDERRLARQRRESLAYLKFAPGELEAARAGAGAVTAALR